MITKEHKRLISRAIADNLPNYRSASKQAIALGINPAQLSQINNGKLDNILSDGKWVSIARRLDVSLSKAPKWITAKTPLFKFITEQLTMCQTGGISAIMCDISDVGKTYAAKQYVRSNKNAVYIDCGQVPQKQNFIRKIAKEFGVPHTGRYKDVYNDLVLFIKAIDDPIIVLDEAGDLSYPAWMVLKALWNATEYACAWYMMGADGLKVKINRNIDLKKVGFTENFTRFGYKYQKFSPDGKEDREDFKKLAVALIAKANGSQLSAQEMYAKTDGSLRRVYIEIQKQNRS